MKEACKEAGIQEPEFNLTNFFTIVFKRIQNVKSKSFNKNFGENFGENINETQFKILECINKNPKISAKKIADKLKLSTRAIEQNIKSLKEKKIVTRRGSAKGGSWEIVYKNI